MATVTRSSTSMSDPFEVAVQKLITSNKACKTPITLEAMVCDRLDQFNRRNSIRVHGIPGSEYVSSPKDTDQAVIDLGMTLNINIISIDIARSHRVGNHDCDRDILVKFIKFSNKIKFMKARMSLKAKKPGVYIKEDLTKHCVCLFTLARRLKCKEVILDTWTKKHKYS